MYYRSYYNPYRGTPIGHAPIAILPIGKNTIGVYTENFCPTDDALSSVIGGTKKVPIGSLL
jgi:hypothetical protein